MELRPETGRPEDRLATAVFVAALLHGLFILGVRFAAPSSDDRPLPTLEVLLVPDGPAEADNPDASYIASRSQHGAGTTQERQRTSLPEAAASLLEHAGEERGDAYAEQASESSAGSSQLLASTSQRSRQVQTGDRAAARRVRARCRSSPVRWPRWASTRPQPTRRCACGANW